MGFETWIGIAVGIAFLGLLLLSTGRTAREGSFRRGVGWHMDVTTPRDVLMGHESGPLPRERTPGWTIRLLGYSGFASIAGATAAVILDAVGLAILLAVCGLGLLGLAWDARRRNRGITSAKEMED